MNISKAIEIETIHNDHNPDYTDAQREEAHQLGIEALKRHQNKASLTFAGMMEPLPGETDDQQKGAAINLPKAIENLKEPGIPWGGEALENHYKARQLGIEALKRLEKARKERRFDRLGLLPGETEE